MKRPLKTPGRPRDSLGAASRVGRGRLGISYRVTVRAAERSRAQRSPASVGRALSAAARTKVHRGGIYGTNHDEAISRFCRRRGRCGCDGRQRSRTAATVTVAFDGYEKESRLCARARRSVQRVLVIVGGGNTCVCKSPVRPAIRRRATPQTPLRSAPHARAR